MGELILQYFEDRIKEEAGYIIEHRATVREAAHVLHIGKSTLHKDVTERLRCIHPVWRRKQYRLREARKQGLLSLQSMPEHLQP